MSSMIKQLCKELKEMGIDFLLVGGTALESQGFLVRTLDVDFALAVKDFNALEEKLKKNPKFKVIDRLNSIIGTEFAFEDSWIDVEFISLKLFSGKISSEQFFNYLIKNRTICKNDIFIAKPEVVWYMRLAIADWKIYVQKIIRDIIVGVPENTLEKSLEIAKKTGLEKELKKRIEEVKEILKTRNL